MAHHIHRMTVHAIPHYHQQMVSKSHWVSTWNPSAATQWETSTVNAITPKSTHAEDRELRGIEGLESGTTMGEWQWSMTLWTHQLTREDKLRSMLKVTGSFCKKKKNGEKTDKHGRERDLWLEKLWINRFCKKKHNCFSVLMSYKEREGKKRAFVAHTIINWFRGKSVYL